MEEAALTGADEKDWEAEREDLQRLTGEIAGLHQALTQVTEDRPQRERERERERERTVRVFVWEGCESLASPAGEAGSGKGAAYLPQVWLRSYYHVTSKIISIFIFEVYSLHDEVVDIHCTIWLQAGRRVAAPAALAVRGRHRVRTRASSRAGDAGCSSTRGPAHPGRPGATLRAVAQNGAAQLCAGG